ncbi:hypothetical protein GCM10023189_58270 [Nibrella saemangeumensis]|uniref:MORN repeat variant n=2 Tax=Nibrella saemangeumensis TaxID=1084526 RepID=A0ABP8NS03_9BACT
MYARKERHDRGNRIEEVVYHDRNNLLATLRTYSTGGVLQMEEQYSDYQKRIKNGFTKYWYPSGKLYWISDYRNNVRHGAFLVYTEDGTLKRREYYKNGTRKKAICYGQAGEVVPCTDFLQEARFAADPQQLITHLQTYMDRDLHPLRAPRMLVRFDVGTDGAVENLYFIFPSQEGQVNSPKPFKPANDDEPTFLMDAFEDMPNWKPATFDGIPIRSTVSLAVRYKKGILTIRKGPDHVTR